MSTNKVNITATATAQCLATLEGIIERGQQAFIEVGNALLEIRDRRLYREQGFATFEDYCRKRWNWGRHYVNRQIAAAEVVKNLEPIGTIPKNEAQARELAPLPPEQQREVAGGIDFSTATAADIRAVVEQTSPRAPTAIEQAASLMGVSEHQVHQAMFVQKAAPDLFEGMNNGSLELDDAVKQAKVRATASENGSDFITLTQWKSMSAKAKKAALTIQREGHGHFNKQDDENIGWARNSDNPVTGCLHNCVYCYARDIAERFYPQGFEPALWPARLSIPYHARLPKEAATDISYRNVFMCSMADLFGNWVPAEWIEAVLQGARDNPQWNFLFLTKFPQRMAEFDYPPNAWLGTSVDSQARVTNAERAMAKVKAKVRWVSVEPMLEPIKMDFSIFQWVVMGGASISSQTPPWRPPWRWICEATAEAMKAGCAVYHKTNLFPDRMRDYPGVIAPEPRLPEAFGLVQLKVKP
jgi:protein gp37